ncbi:hypothetical protein [Bradyrhizobium sp. AS23.2]|uniref:hypothetical protein n=1 Tax=Bradyrhizobium sp. AS23.2 TaxID=1680155 RepID=UPI0011611028|nr:hypothetical protein [Bradyrhizobium sp. AS23.2]
MSVLTVPVTITIAKQSEKGILRPLLADYLKELGSYGDVDANYPFFEAYWREPDVRWPYFLFGGTTLIGFAFVRAPAERNLDFSLAEFFIRPHARRNHYGIGAVTAIMLAHPGKWELAVMKTNTVAQRFWPRAIAAAGAQEVRRFDNLEVTTYRFTVQSARTN